jgi:hypothetical protein
VRDVELRGLCRSVLSKVDAFYTIGTFVSVRVCVDGTTLVFLESLCAVLEVQ